jgi:hypothetical protein
MHISILCSIPNLNVEAGKVNVLFGIDGNA